MHLRPSENWARAPKWTALGRSYTSTDMANLDKEGIVPAEARSTTIRVPIRRDVRGDLERVIRKDRGTT